MRVAPAHCHGSPSPVRASRVALGCGCVLLTASALPGCNDDDYGNNGIPFGSPSAAIQSVPTVSGLTFVQLNGSPSSDPNAGPLEYAWSQVGGPPVVLTSTDQVQTSFLAPNEDVSLTFRLTVEDLEGLTAATEITVDVTSTLPFADIQRLAGFAVAGGGEGQAEIVSYHAASQRLFAISGGSARLDAYDLSDPANPAEVGSLSFDGSDPSLPVGEPNSVASSAQFLAVALAAPVKQDPGSIVLLDPETLDVVGVTEAGALPDMLAFTPDGTRLLACNEGEPNADFTVNPPGSLTIVWIDAQGIEATYQVSFAETDVLKDAAIANGFRFIADPSVSLSQDLEPEYLALTADSKYAYIACQENNCVLVYDVVGRDLLGAYPLGTKDWESSAQTRWFDLALIELGSLPVAGTTADGEALRFGGLAGLHGEGEDADGRLLVSAIPSGGPRLLPPVGGVRQALPDYQHTVLRLAIDPTNGQVEVLSTLPLFDADGETPLGDRPNLQGSAPGLAHYDTETLDLDGEALPLDPSGLLVGGLVVAPNGELWIADEHRPSIARFSAEGTLLARYVPAGSNAFGVQLGIEALPEAYARRVEGRGFTAIAFDEGTGWLHLWNESSLDNPDTPQNTTANAARFARQLVFDPATESVVAEYIVPLERPGGRSRIAGASWSGEPGVFTLLEYGLPTGVGEGSDSRPALFRVDVNGATNLLELPDPQIASDVLELQSSEVTLLAEQVHPVVKTAHAALSRLGNAGLTLPSGLARTGDDRWLVLQDDRYGLLGPLLDPAVTDLEAQQANAPGSRVALVETLPVGMDPSDQDDGAQFGSWPVAGLFMPDGIATFELDGQRYLVTANEGDSREYEGTPGYVDEARLADSPKPLDTEVFPDAAALLADEALGRLKVSTVDGDDDGDGFLERIPAFGARSFSIWRADDGQLIYDSADELARAVFDLEPEWHNANGDPGKVDERSDDKGVEPEGLAVGEVAGRPFLFLGLERTNHVMVYDLSSPRAPALTSVLRFDGDVSPEGLTFVPAAESPTGDALLVVGYEVSGTVAIYELRL
jgi:DNA-binding beta-propeller fold protein YncE